jgi:hypothetical protein
MQQPETRSLYVLRVRNDGYPASLEPRKVCEALSDPAAEARQYRRVVDESGEDDLYPADFFVPIDLPHEAKHAYARTL